MAGLGQAGGVRFQPIIGDLGRPLATLEYAGVSMGVARTLEFVCEPESDYAGVNYLGINHVVIGVRAWVNPAAIASLSGQNQGATGDRAGTTLAILQEVLMQKQQTLIYRIGPDEALRAPDDPEFLCDAKWGPNPLALRVLEVHGAKTAVIYFRIECWIGTKAGQATVDLPIVLSNRWSVQASVDDDWKTTIVTTGRMRLRPDVLLAHFNNPGLVDRFRGASLPLPIPDGFKRRIPMVLITPDATEIQWQTIDEQQILSVSPNVGATRVEGQYTVGFDFGFKDMKDIAKHTAQGVGDLFKAAGQAFELNPDAFTTLADAFGNIFDVAFPGVRNTFQFRITGPPQGDRTQLFKIALGLVIDRFAPQGNLGFGGGGMFLTSLYATFPIAETAVELRGATLGNIGQGVQGFNPATLSSQVNTGEPTLAGLGLSYLRTPNPNPPNDNASRGTWVGAIIEQALLGNFSLPTGNQPSEQDAALQSNPFE